MEYHKAVKIECLCCGKERKVYYSDIQRGRGKYCNRKCWDKYKRKIPELVKCKECQSNFTDTYSQYKKFCSRKCYADWQKGKPTYPNILGKRGIKPRTYHKKKRPKHGGAEYNDWRIAVWKRDKFICQRCGKTANKLKKEKVKICADHIKPFCNYPKLRYEINNGITL